MHSGSFMDYGFHSRLQPEAGVASRKECREFDYEVDEGDRLTWVSDAWLRFAEENAARALTGADVLGQSLWKSIGNWETRHIYEQLFRRVRERGVPLQVPFRCDGPAVRRFMELEIAPRGGGKLRLTGVLRREEERPPIELLSASARRNDDEIITLCAWCKAGRLKDGRWTSLEEVVTSDRVFETDHVPSVSHGICPDCHDDMLGYLRTASSA